MTNQASASVVFDDSPLPDSIEIAAPLGGTLNAEDDLDAAQEGLQTDVTVKSFMLSGGTVRLCLVAEGFEGNGGCKEAEGKVLGEPVALSTTGTTTFARVTLPEGLDLVLTAEYEAANGEIFLSQTVPLVVDTIAPTISFVSPRDGEMVGARTFDVVLDTDAEANQRVTIESSARPGELFYDNVGADGSAVVFVSLEPGAQELTASLTDKAGNPATASIQITVDVAGCLVEITDPPAGEHFYFNLANTTAAEGSARTYTLRGSTENCAGGTVRVTKTVESVSVELGTAVAAEDGSFSFEAELADGETNASLNVKVEKGLSPNDGVTLLYTADFTPPSISFAIPADGQLITQQTTPVRLETEGLDEGAAVVIASPQQTITSHVTAGGEVIATLGLALGPQTLTASATDRAGNPASKSIGVTVDVDGCDVEVSAPGLNAVFNLANATVDSSASPRTGTYLIEGHTERCPNGTVRFTKNVNGVQTELGTATADAQGDFSFLATFVDGETDAVLNVKVEAGLAPNAGVDIVYTADFTPPTVAFLAPLDGALLTAQTTTVQVQTTGLEAGASVSIASPAQTVTATTDATGLASAAVSLSLGQQTLTASVADAAGNPAEASISVTVDVEGCDVVVTSPAPTFVFNRLNSTVDDSSSPKTGTYEIVGRTDRCPNGTVRVSKTVDGITSELGTTLADDQGAFRYLATLVDGESGATLNVKVEGGLAPNDGVDITYSADFTAPTIAFIAPASDALIVAETTTVALQTEGVEAGTPVTIASPAETVTANTDATGRATASIELAPGRQTLTAEVEDAAGNPASASVDVLMDLEGCDVVVNDPAGPVVFNTSNSTVDGSVSPRTGTYTVVGRTDRCPNGTVRFTKTVGGIATELGTATANEQGIFSFLATFVDGEADATLNVKVEAGLAPNAGFDIGYTADFTPPSLVSALPALGALTIVHPSNPHVGEPGYVADADLAAAGGQVDIELVVNGAGSIASTGSGSVAISGTTPAYSRSIASNGQETISARVTFAEGFDGLATITLTDAAGNVATGEWNVRVATSQLPTPTIGLPSAGTINVFRDLGGDRATYAVVQGRVDFSASAPSGAQVYVCSNAPGFTGVGACNTSGFYEIASTRHNASGNSQFYAALRLPQGVQQLIAEMSDAVGAHTSSAAVNLNVDTVPPVVTSVVALEDADGDGLLSGSELPIGQQARVEVRVTGVPDGTQVTLHDGATALPRLALAGGKATFMVSLSDGLHVLHASVTDPAGNPNESTSTSPPIVNEAATLRLQVDREAPSISIPSPTFTVCNGAADDNKSTPECDLVLTALVGTGATRVTFSGPGNPVPATVDAPFTNNRATARYQLGQGGPFTLVATVFDAVGNSRQAAHTLTVDTIAPTLEFLSPSNGAVISSQSFPVSIRATGAEPGRIVTVTSSVDGAIVGQGPVGADGLASFTVVVPNANQTLTASVSDLAGNAALPATIDIQLNIEGCDVRFTYPVGTNVTFNTNNAPTGEVTITGYSSREGCQNREVRFYAKVGSAPESLVGTATTDDNGNFSYTHTFADGTITVFSAELTFGLTNRGSFTATTDITPPTLTLQTPVVAADRKLYVVAASGNVNVRDGLVGYVPDADENLPDGQVTFDITVAGAGAFDESTGGSLVIYKDETPILSEAITSNGTVSLTDLTATLEQAFVGTVTVAVTDAAGNEALAHFDTTVDVVPPEAPVIVTSDSGTGAFTQVTDPRSAALDAWGTSPSDSGPQPDSVDCTFGVTTGTRLDTAPFDLNKFYSDLTWRSEPARPPSPGSVLHAQFYDLPPINTYLVALNCRDAVGNSQQTHAELGNSWRRHSESYAGPNSNPLFAFYLSTGDVNGDGAVDIAASAVTDGGNRGSVTVYFGGQLPFASSQRLEGTSDWSFFANPFELWDMNGDGQSELVAYESDHLDIYASPGVGMPLAPIPSFSITGDPGVLYMKRVGDLNGDAKDDLAISNPYYSPGGRVYVFFTRDDWSGLAQGAIIDISDADLIITTSSSGARLGAQGGMFSLPDSDSDGRDELVIGSSGSNEAFVFLSQLFPARSLSVNNASARLAMSGTQFGLSGISVHLNPDDLPDVLISDPSNRVVYRFDQTAPGVFSAATVFSRGSGNHGWDFASGDLDGDGVAELVIGTNNSLEAPVLIHFGNAGGLGPVESRLSGTGMFGATVRVADLNADGANDLVVAESGTENGKFTVIY
ncbi:MAG: FG-GAP-like repeat-containing protein [Myxococcales bacterium]